MSSIENVLFVTFDQWRGDCVGIGGNPILRTPHVDALVRDATYFRNHWSATCPCGPGRTSLFTGTYQHNHRALRNGTPLANHFTNLALEARKLGWDPVLFGYTDISPDPTGRESDDKIFDTYEGVLPGMTRLCRLDDDMSLWTDDLRKRGYDIPDDPWDLFAPDADEAEKTPGKAYTYPPIPLKTEDTQSAWLTDKTLDYLKAEQGKGWFAHVSYLTPHPPFAASSPYNARYDAADMPAPVRASTPAEEAALHPWTRHRIETYAVGGPSSASGAYRGFSILSAEIDDALLAQTKATYYGMINEVEDNFARIVDHLKATGEYDKTLIVLTSDHGEQMGDHWMMSKQGYWDESYHIPLIIRDPRPEAESHRGRIVEAFTGSPDVTPTVLDLLGGAVPGQCDGAPLTPWIEGEEPADWRDFAAFEFHFGEPLNRKAETALGIRTDQCGIAVMRGERYKYVQFAGGLPPLLFDLETDRKQLTNVADDPAYRDVALEAARKMLSWRLESEDRRFTNTVVDGGLHDLPDERFEGEEQQMRKPAA